MYTYDLAGDLTSQNTVESGITFTYQYDGATRPTLMTSSLVDANHPGTLATVDSTLGYYPTGALRKITDGNGLTETSVYNNRLQPCRLNVPSSDKVIRENLQELINKYERLVTSIEKPVTDEEARVLVNVFGPDDGFGIVWPLVALIESAPGWPLGDCLQDTTNEWVDMLQQRVKNSARRQSRQAGP